MSDWLYAVLVFAAGAVCPVHMWWQHRRGRRALCCPVSTRKPAADAAPGSADLVALRRRQLELAARIAELDAQLPSRAH